jgi:hypothetical protein
MSMVPMTAKLVVEIPMPAKMWYGVPDNNNCDLFHSLHAYVGIPLVS